MKTVNYEQDDKTFNAEAYKVKGWNGIAFHVLGWELQDNEETEWSGYQEKTGKVIAVMVGDDRCHTVEESDLIPIEEKEYCGGCGQIGCTADGREQNGILRAGKSLAKVGGHTAGNSSKVIPL